MKSSQIARNAFVSAAMLSTTQAYGYNWITHSQMVEAAVLTMHSIPLAASPAANQNQWHSYLVEVRAAAARLRGLETGLGVKETTIPENISECGYDWSSKSRDHNLDLSNLDSIKLRRFPYYPVRPKVACTLTYAPPSAKDAQGSIINKNNASNIGKILGWHAAMVDDHVDDTVFGVKATNILFLDKLKPLLANVATIIGGTVVAPLVCIYGLFKKSSCNPKSGYEFFKDNNPIWAIDATVPIVGTLKGDWKDGMTGLWHFMHLESSHQTYNQPRGMDYRWSGPGETPGAIDVAIHAVTEVAGFTLRYEKCDGAKNYGHYDQHSRTADEWQRYSMGSTEFSPVQNLAHYGWSEFQKSGRSARWLGWPLHAIGDAAEPHHIVATTGWGHRPYEDAVERFHHEFFKLDAERHVLEVDDAQAQRILLAGYQLWTQLRETRSAGVSMHELVTQVGRKTQQLVQDKGGWPYVDERSTAYFLGGEGSKLIDDGFPKKVAEKLLGAKQVAVTTEDLKLMYERSIDAYHDHTPDMKQLVEHGTGAMVVLLTFAAQQVPPLDNNESDPLCPENTHYVGGSTNSCQSNPSIPTPPVQPPTQPAPCLPGWAKCTADLQCCSRACNEKDDIGSPNSYCSPVIEIK